MKRIKINLNKVTPEQFKTIINYLQPGKVIVYPTDTIYGLGCLATDRKAISKIFRIKKRGKNKPLLILIDSFAMLKKYCLVSKKQLDYLHQIWPGPISVVLKSRGILPRELTGDLNSTAVRLPQNDFLIKILRKIKVPLISTSFNISGQGHLIKVDGIERYFNTNQPDLIIDASISKRSKPSKILDLRDINNIKILRN